MVSGIVSLHAGHGMAASAEISEISGNFPKFPEISHFKSFPVNQSKICSGEPK
jgi:hypothetical protein